MLVVLLTILTCAEFRDLETDVATSAFYASLTGKQKAHDMDRLVDGWIIDFSDTHHDDELKGGSYLVARAAFQVYAQPFRSLYDAQELE